MKNLLLAIALLLFSAVVAEPQRRVVDEASVVLAYLYNFGKFVTWPEGSLGPSGAPLLYCIYGENPFGSLTKTISSKRVQGRPIKVVNIKRGGAVKLCDVLFVSRSENFYLRPLLSLVQERPVLTVSEIEGFAEMGGTIGLVFSDSRLRFEINRAAAHDSGLRISSQLLALAVQVLGVP